MDHTAPFVSSPALQPALHLGTLHPAEQALVWLLAIGPFVVLGLVVRHQRRRDAQRDDPPRSG